MASVTSVSLAVSFLLMLLVAIFFAVAVVPLTATTGGRAASGNTLEPLPHLVVDGSNIRFPNGSLFYGRGVNLGTWFTLNNQFGGIKPDGVEFAFFNQSDTRWGEAKTRELMNIYIDHAMSIQDFDLINSMGFNMVRLPLHYRNFQWKNGTWIRDSTGEIDFTRLDWAIGNITANGLYVVLDLHNWFGYDVWFEAISQNDPKLSTEQRAMCILHRSKAADFLSNLTRHVKNVPGILVLYSAVRKEDRKRIFIRYFSVDRIHPSQYGWENVVYAFHTYEGQQTISGFIANVQDKVKENYPVPYFISEWHFADPSDSQRGVNHMDKLSSKIPLWALWTYKAVWMNNWALVNYNTSFIVNVTHDSWDDIVQVWRKMPTIDIRSQISPWGDSMLPVSLQRAN
ncbi:glycoside hydrolase superfamily [Obelidium mucronatum]|nr:glycoside hydrolase superfamily [Obelidium mucronatum]